MIRPNDRIDRSLGERHARSHAATSPRLGAKKRETITRTPAQSRRSWGSIGSCGLRMLGAWGVSTAPTSSICHRFWPRAARCLMTPRRRRSPRAHRWGKTQPHEDSASPYRGGLAASTEAKQTSLHPAENTQEVLRHPVKTPRM